MKLSEKELRELYTAYFDGQTIVNPRHNPLAYEFQTKMFLNSIRDLLEEMQVAVKDPR